jgi:hypothetical protein
MHSDAVSSQSCLTRLRGWSFTGHWEPIANEIQASGHLLGLVG